MRRRWKKRTRRISSADRYTKEHTRIVITELVRVATLLVTLSRLILYRDLMCILRDDA